MKKKIGLMVTMMALVITFVGCAANPRSQFVDYLTQQPKEQFNAGNFDLSIADIELDDKAQSGSDDPLVGMVMSQLKNIKFSGTYQQDVKEKETIKVGMNLDLMGMKIPMDMVGTLGDKPKMYLSTNFIAAAMDLAQLFGGQEAIALPDVTKLNGKYLDIKNLSDTLGSKEANKSTEKELKNATEFGEAYQKEVIAYLNKVDKKKFIKKDDTISHTFTQKEISDLIALLDKVAKSDKKFADFAASQETPPKLSEIVKELSVAFEINTKKHTYKATTILVPKDETSGLKRLKMLATGKRLKNKESVTLPKPEEVLAEEELEAIFAPSAKDVTISDSDFAEIKKSLSAEKDSISKAEATELLSAYKNILSAEQYSEIEALLK